MLTHTKLSDNILLISGYDPDIEYEELLGDLYVKEIILMISKAPLYKEKDRLPPMIVVPNMGRRAAYARFVRERIENDLGLTGIIGMYAQVLSNIVQASDVDIFNDNRGYYIEESNHNELDLVAMIHSKATYIIGSHSETEPQTTGE